VTTRYPRQDGGGLVIDGVSMTRTPAVRNRSKGRIRRIQGGQKRAVGQRLRRSRADAAGTRAQEVGAASRVAGEWS